MRLLKSILIIFLMYSLLWTPLIITTLFDGSGSWPQWFYLLATDNSIVYAASNPTFREGYVSQCVSGRRVVATFDNSNSASPDDFPTIDHNAALMAISQIRMGKPGFTFLRALGPGHGPGKNVPPPLIMLWFWSSNHMRVSNSKLVQKPHPVILFREGLYINL